MQGLPAFDDPNLIVGAEHFSDAGVYRIENGLAIVQSVDFFPPLVDDPYEYGRIAAANAMSDVFAMGGAVRTALNIVSFPDDELELAILSRILDGGAERVTAAGGVVLGGHSIRSAEITYGLAVTGVADPSAMMTNAAARPGDALVLTKAIGTGYVTTALRAGRCADDILHSTLSSMIALNRAASETAVAHGARASTDITGFGLAGHALEMARASEVTLSIDLDRVPLLPGVPELMQGDNRTRANETNQAHVALDATLPDHPRLDALFDPQTSGGLLIAIAGDRVEALVSALHDAGDTVATIIGAVAPLGDRPLLIN